MDELVKERLGNVFIIMSHVWITDGVDFNWDVLSTLDKSYECGNLGKHGVLHRLLFTL